MMPIDPGFIVNLPNLAPLQSRKLFACKTTDRVRELVSKGANVDCRQGNGVTPLLIHTDAKEKEIVQELLRQKANIDLQDNDG